MTRHLTPDEMRGLDDDALANLIRWRREECDRLRRDYLAADEALREAAAERDRRTNRGARPMTPGKGNP